MSGLESSATGGFGVLEEWLARYNLRHVAGALRELGAYDPGDLQVHTPPTRIHHPAERPQCRCLMALLPSAACCCSWRPAWATLCGKSSSSSNLGARGNRPGAYLMAVHGRSLLSLLRTWRTRTCTLLCSSHSSCAGSSARERSTSTSRTSGGSSSGCRSSSCSRSTSSSCSSACAGTWRRRTSRGRRATVRGGYRTRPRPRRGVPRVTCRPRGRSPRCRRSSNH